MRIQPLARLKTTLGDLDIPVTDTAIAVQG
jgi:hypothetical protein